MNKGISARDTLSYNYSRRDTDIDIHHTLIPSFYGKNVVGQNPTTRQVDLIRTEQQIATDDRSERSAQNVRDVPTYSNDAKFQREKSKTKKKTEQKTSFIHYKVCIDAIYLYIYAYARANLCMWFCISHSHSPASIGYVCKHERWMFKCLFETAVSIEMRSFCSTLTYTYRIRKKDALKM